VDAPSLGLSVPRRKFLLPVFAGGITAGALDLISAFVTYGWGVPRAIASGLLGAQALHGGVTTWILGVVLHFFIALSAAVVYCLASERLEFLKEEHFFVCGVFYGIAVFLVMNLIVLPLSAVPFKVGPFTVSALIRGLLVHMFLIGLPISSAARKFLA
jgi:uncharacterized membrane protein YagU involved in acid resistance